MQYLVLSIIGLRAPISLKLVAEKEAQIVPYWVCGMYFKK